MPYASQIRVNDDTGNAFNSLLGVSIDLLQLNNPIGSTQSWQVDQEQVSVSVPGANSLPFSMTSDPSFPFSSIALAAFQSGLPGPMFRSGKLESLPAGAPGNADGLIDIMILPAQRFSMAAVNATIQVPMTLEDGTIVTSVTLTSDPATNTLTIVAMGPYGATTFTYTLDFRIDPSNDQFHLDSVLEAHAATNRGTLVFTAGGGGGLQALKNNLFQGIFVGRATGQLLQFITSSLDTIAASAAASAFAAAGIPGGMPAGVVLGVRSSSVASNGDILIRPAIGCFGSLQARFLSAMPVDWRDNDLSILASQAADAPPVMTIAAGDPMGYVFSDIQHVVFRATDDHIHELWWEPQGTWHDYDLSQLTGAPRAFSNPMGYVFSGIQHVVFRATDSHIHELWWDPPGVWRDNNLSILASQAADAPPVMPTAVGDPNGYVFSGIQHVVFRATDGHIHELWWDPQGTWHDYDLSQLTGAPTAAGDPMGYVFFGIQHVVFRATDGHIHELWWDPPGVWHDNDLSILASQAADAPPVMTIAAGDPNGYVFSDIQHVVFRATDGHIHELWWEPQGTWHDNDLNILASRAADAPPVMATAAGDPMGYVFFGIQHVVFRATDGHIHELWWDPPGVWHDKDLSQLTGAPRAFSDPMGYVFANLQHVVFPGTDGHIHELYN